MTRARDIANFGGGIATADIDDGAVTAGKLNSTLDLTGKTVTLPAGVGGKLLQVQHTRITSSFTTTSTSFADVTDTSISFTPILADSVIWVTYSCITFGQQGHGGIDVQLTDGTTVYAGVRQISRYDMQSNRTQYLYERHGSSQDWFVDSWGTSAKTLKIQGRNSDSAGQPHGVEGGPAQDHYLIVREIAG